MESFSLLKYWRGGGGAASSVTKTRAIAASNTSSATTPIVTAVSPSSSSSSDVNDGPFFDLEFSLPDDESDAELLDPINEEKKRRNFAAIVEDFVNENDIEEEEEENQKENLISDLLSDDDENISLSPSDNVFFKDQLVPIESSSSSSAESDAIVKFPVSSILKSATKFRLLMLKLREKTKKSEEKNGGKDKKPQQQSKFFIVKLKAEEVPLVSLFTRDNSSKGSKKSANNEAEISDDKNFSKDVILQKYLKKVKPLYVRVSKRYGEKLNFSPRVSSKSGADPSPPPLSVETTAEVKSPTETSEEVVGEVVAALPNSKSIKQGNLHAGLRVVCKHLGKSRSATSADVAVASLSSKRRDDSLLQQHDGIQSAILHCKRSFNASRDLEGLILSSSSSETSHEKSVTLSTEESSSSPSPEEANGQRE